MLPSNLFFLIQGSYSTFRKEVLQVQRISCIRKNLRTAIFLGSKPINASFSTAGDVMLHKGKLWVPALRLQLKILYATHNQPLLGHPCREKLMNLVPCDFSWAGMRPHVQKVLEGCATCARVKLINAKLAGVLNPLQHSSGTCQSLRVEFVTAYLRCKGFDEII